MSALAELHTAIRTVSVSVVAGQVDTDASLGGTLIVSAAGSFTLNNPTHPTDGKKHCWRVKNTSGSSITITLGNAFRFGTDLTALRTVAAGKTTYFAAIYNEADGKWDLMCELTGY